MAKRFELKERGTGQTIYPITDMDSVIGLEFFKGYDTYDDFNDINLTKHIMYLTINDRGTQINKTLDINGEGVFEGAETLIFIHCTNKQTSLVIDVPGFEGNDNPYTYNFKLYGLESSSQGITLDGNSGDIIISCIWFNNTWHIRKV